MSVCVYVCGSALGGPGTRTAGRCELPAGGLTWILCKSNAFLNY